MYDWNRTHWLPQNDSSISQSIFKKTIFEKHVYRDYKHFNQNGFLHELDLEMNKGKFCNSASPHDDFSNLFKKKKKKKKKILIKNNQ